MTMNCTKCSVEVPPSYRLCPTCGEDNGCPNVRLANDPSEIAAFNQRVSQAKASIAARKIEPISARFEERLQHSHAIISRPLMDVYNLLNSDQEVYSTFLARVRAQARLPEQNDYDPVRVQFESALFPHFHEEIRFGFLSLELRPLAGYGSCALVLKPNAIDTRASVFEENPFDFFPRHKLGMGSLVPPGYRADWPRRHLLALCKHHSKLDPSTLETDFQDILVADHGGTGNSDFVEVHIYGPLTRRSVQCVVGPKNIASDEAVLWQKIVRIAQSIGIHVEQY